VCVVAGGVAVTEDRPLGDALAVVAGSVPADLSLGLLSLRQALGP
jgi:hypothetical protein